MAAYYLRFYVMKDAAAVQPVSGYLRATAFYAIAIVIIYIVADVYAPMRRTLFPTLVRKIIVCNLAGVLALGTVLFAVRFVDFSRLLLGYHYLISTFAVCGKHYVLRKAMRYARRRGYNLRHVLVVGNGTLAADYGARVFGERICLGR